MRLVWKQAALPGTSRLKIWRRVGDSNSCALAVRQFSGLLGYQLPIPSTFQKETWYRTSDSNRDCSVPKTDASCQLG